VHIGFTSVQPVSIVRDHGVIVDAYVTMKEHVTATVRSCFAAIRQIRSVRRALPQHADLTLVRALVVSKVDHCATVLVGVSGRLLDRLQSVLNAAARLIFSARRSDHISPLLYDLHWLWIPERIKFRLCSLTFRCVHGTAPSYLAVSLRRTVIAEGRRHLRSSVTTSLVVPSTRRSTLGDRAFPVAAARMWNKLPASVRNAPSLLTFSRELKILLFRRSFNGN